MAYIGAVLGWKFNHRPGITTVDGVIKEWPGALGPKPTQEQINTWNAEYEAAMDALNLAAANLAAAKEQAIIDNIPTWAQVEAAIDACDTLAKLRAVVKKIARVVYWDVKNSAD